MDAHLRGAHMSGARPDTDHKQDLKNALGFTAHSGCSSNALERKIS